MRILVSALSLVMVATVLLSVGGAVPAVAAASDPKVVVIVGPTEGSTDNYRDAADEAAAEAAKYTSNVVKVYSPNATWSAVKTATKGASIVIYLGHGNGWPSPYTYDPKYTTKDGFGLNAAAGKGDSNNKYYGEPYVKTLELASNAVIILNHLCYASGNSEPGKAQPSLSVAKERISNFAAGFMAGKAAAVIAEGHGSAADYVRALFTHDGSVFDAWNSVNANGNTTQFTSTRSSSVQAYMDPDTPTSGFYRSLVVKPGLTTASVFGTTPAAVPYPGTPFVDIASSTFRNDVVWLYGSGITAGCEADRYCPDRTVSRGEMAAFIVRALGLPSTSVDAFEDDSGNTFEGDINRLAAAGIAVGCATDRYCPDEPMLREQMATFLTRASELAATSTDYFDDDDGNPHEDDIDALAKAGITSGCGARLFCPSETVTRGQMAAFLHRAFPDAG